MLLGLLFSSALLSLILAENAGEKTVPGYLRSCKCVPTDDLVKVLSDEELVANDPIALDTPINDSCPPINFAAGDIPGNCSIGDAPRYVVNATTPGDVARGVDFARKNNTRLVIRSTGHDLLGRSTGYGSLEIWIRYLEQGIVFQDTYSPSDGCKSSNWEGSAFKIAGGYVWEDVYAEATKRNVIVVGGGDPTVGCIGGWAQGGGHSPASRDYGLGADQILEAEVVLANGEIITTNKCQNQDIYFAIRGGGGGKFAVVVSTTIKAYPTTSISAQTLAIAPLTDADIPGFMAALALICSAYPDLNDAGLSVYGSWAVQSYAPVVDNFTTGYEHALAVSKKSLSETKAMFAPVMSKLDQYNSSIFVNPTYLTFPTYAAYYKTLSGGKRAAGIGTAAFGGRFLDRTALTSSLTNLDLMLNITAGSQGQFTSTCVSLVGGGQVFVPDPSSGLNPAWRSSYVHNIVARGWTADTNEATVQEIKDDITYTKVGAMKNLAPHTGCYTNEANRLDPDYLQDFYGESLAKLKEVKNTYDGDDVFYCPTCVGSEKWVEDMTGRLCRTP
ncbi:hypothetical protein sscle_01g011270 [Sclerotinia sclerotiorum 1980 UF-70]|uniref:FAD-binding PCMH-type domain-containing protein n=1 Tax=Sclerotinia sclerotiorum (strain ATCC 18683 / 1980 / Ss-1) TaxID=665079 RepID=A0A1D9PUJ8_SCLS1|nr:hypothetical protein sscle_01g011270 [Sclerotinia sclerotiorum 1980 UF-70]